ncbi:uncharacterized protein LOC113504884 [Trichoplusia ni]|uniref:Uncharacterized protein LOC113504884 n=1 Tax=Trichoplusia ni TaxID=7111 RepID=A0A7E5WR46_TRINI|nr:uncharacterized protein LOC113504884 [Trichoplusia ni]
MACGINLDEFKIGTAHRAVVGHINDPHSFYIRPYKLSGFLEDLENQSHHRDPPKDSVTYGQVILFRSQKLKKMARGKICYIHTDRRTMSVCYDIFAIDYGHVEKAVPLSNVGKIDPLSEIPSPPLTIHCRVSHCEPKGSYFTEEVIDHFKFFMATEHIGISINARIQDKLLVDIQTPDIHDLATLMSDLNYTVLWKPIQLNQMADSSPNSLDFSSLSLAIKSPQFRHKLLPPGITFHGIVLSGECVLDFYVADKNEFKNIMCLSEHYKKEMPDKLLEYDKIIPGLHCVASVFNDSFERVVVKEVSQPNQKAIVQLLDWGSFAEVSFSNIRLVTNEFTYNQPIVAHYCEADPEQVRENNIPDFLHHGLEYTIQVLDLGHGFEKRHKVNMYPAFCY